MSFFSKNALEEPCGAASAVVVGSALISFIPFFVEFSHLSALSNSFYRLAIGGGILLLIALYRKESFPNMKMFGLCFLTAATVAFETVFWNQSVLLIGAGLSTVLGNLEAFFMIILGVIFFKEKLKPQFFKLAGFIFIGVLFLIFPYLFEMPFYKCLGIGLAIGASLFYSLHFNLFKIISTRNPKKEVPKIALLATICLMAAAIVGLFIACIPNETFAITSAKSFYCVLLNSLLGQVIGWLLITSGLKDIDLPFSCLLMLTQPALAFIFDCIILGRNTHLVQIGGCMLLLAAVYYTTQLYNSNETSQAFI